MNFWLKCLIFLAIVVILFIYFFTKSNIEINPPGLVLPGNCRYGDIYNQTLDLNRLFPGSPFFDHRFAGGRVESYFQRTYGYPGDYLLGFDRATPKEVLLLQRKNQSPPIAKLVLKTMPITLPIILLDIYFDLKRLNEILTWVENFDSLSKRLNGKVQITKYDIHFKGVFFGTYPQFCRVKIPESDDENIRFGTYLDLLNFIDEDKRDNVRFFNRIEKWKKKELETFATSVKNSIEKIDFKVNFWFLSEKNKEVRFLFTLENLSSESDYETDRFNGFVQRIKIYFSRKRWKNNLVN